MLTVKFKIKAIIVFLFFLCPIVLMGKENLQILKFDKNSIVEIEGKIQNIETQNWYGTKKENFVIVLKDKNNESVKVDLGCTGLYKTSPKKNDSIKIVGSKVSYNNEIVILSVKVKMEKEEIIIRNENGVPLWLDNSSNKMKNKRKKIFMYKMRKNMRRH